MRVGSWRGLLQVLESSVQAWRAEAELLRRYGQALTSALQLTAQRAYEHVFKAWASFIQTDLARQRWESTARRALRAWQWRATLKWEIAAASAELQSRMNRWSVFQAWCSWLRIHDNACAIRWMLHRSTLLYMRCAQKKRPLDFFVSFCRTVQHDHLPRQARDKLKA
jgi:hypothetical protein